jgi:putative PIN family toxin of toxin-antitoxin system
VVLDTNVLVSALLTPSGAPARVLEELLAQRSVLLFDDRILHEYRRVLARKRFGFSSGDVADLLEFLQQEGEQWAAPASDSKTSDPADQMFLDVALAASADALITGNRRHFPRPAAARIWSPRQFVEEVRAQARGNPR